MVNQSNPEKLPFPIFWVSADTLEAKQNHQEEKNGDF